MNSNGRRLPSQERKPNLTRVTRWLALAELRFLVSLEGFLLWRAGRLISARTRNADRIDSVTARQRVLRGRLGLERQPSFFGEGGQ